MTADATSRSMTERIHDRLAETGRLVWVFDGHCVLCVSGVRFAAKRDPDARIGYLPILSTLGREAAAAAGVDPDNPATFLVYDRGRAFQKSGAVIRIGRRLGGVWAALSWTAWLIPRPVRDWAYGVIARNRFAWFGRRTDQCWLDDLGLAERVID